MPHLVFSAWLSLNMYAQPGIDMNNVYRKDSITVVITDSGLGGLSVMNYLAARLEQAGSFSEVNLIFVNALFDKETGYNTLQTREEKVSTFNRVLESIGRVYKPDVILIACNTLSVIYRDTQFANSSDIPIIGIVEPGVELILSKLVPDAGSSVIIMGTETTISEGTHRRELLENNIEEERIVTEPCPQLQSYIEEDPESEMVEMLISFYVNEALQKTRQREDKIYLSLNCSHFGYSLPLWKKACENQGYDIRGILDPNYLMCDALIPLWKDKQFQSQP
ncbi:MAG: aspartate/glutamate racemase family protein [Bacteroidales bacterium]